MTTYQTLKGRTVIVIHLGNINKAKTFNLCMNFSITKKNVMRGHEITETSIYILQDLNCMESLRETRHGILKLFFYNMLWQ
jgi:hypothetical protein